MTASQEQQQLLLAYKSPAAWILFLALLLGGLWADLWSKSFVFAHLANARGASRIVIPHVMSFTLSTNPGIVFGLEVPPALVLAATVLAVVAVVYFFATSPRRSYATHAALGMILAGALGNMYDRLFGNVQIPGREQAVHQVRDFIDLSQIHYPWVFNIADVLLVVGVAILMLLWVAQGRKQPAAAQGPK